MTAGVSVFGPANRAQSYRFLAYHGVRPGVVWAARLLVWGIVMTGILSVAAVVPVVIVVTMSSHRGNIRDVFYGCFVIFEAFVIGVFAGQVVRRSITAWVVATLAFVLLVMPQFCVVRVLHDPDREPGPVPVAGADDLVGLDQRLDERSPRGGRWLRLGE